MNTFPCGIIPFHENSNLNYAYPKAMNTENLVFCKKPCWYSKGAVLLIPANLIHSSIWLWICGLLSGRIDGGNCAAVGFKPEFPRLNRESLGAWAGKVDESIGSNEISFTQLVGEMLGVLRKHPAGVWDRSQNHIFVWSRALLPNYRVVCDLWKTTASAHTQEAFIWDL